MTMQVLFLSQINFLFNALSNLVLVYSLIHWLDNDAITRAISSIFTKVIYPSLIRANWIDDLLLYYERPTKYGLSMANLFEPEFVPLFDSLAPSFPPEIPLSLYSKPPIKAQVSPNEVALYRPVSMPRKKMKRPPTRAKIPKVNETKTVSKISRYQNSLSDKNFDIDASGSNPVSRIRIKHKYSKNPMHTFPNLRDAITLFDNEVGFRPLKPFPSSSLYNNIPPTMSSNFIWPTITYPAIITGPPTILAQNHKGFTTPSYFRNLISTPASTTSLPASQYIQFQKEPLHLVNHSIDLGSLKTVSSSMKAKGYGYTDNSGIQLSTSSPYPVYYGNGKSNNELMKGTVEDVEVSKNGNQYNNRYAKSDGRFSGNLYRGYITRGTTTTKKPDDTSAESKYSNLMSTTDSKSSFGLRIRGSVRSSTTTHKPPPLPTPQSIQSKSDGIRLNRFPPYVDKEEDMITEETHRSGSDNVVNLLLDTKPKVNANTDRSSLLSYYSSLNKGTKARVRYQGPSVRVTPRSTTRPLTRTTTTLSTTTSSTTTPSTTTASTTTPPTSSTTIHSARLRGIWRSYQAYLKAKKETSTTSTTTTTTTSSTTASPEPLRLETKFDDDHYVDENQHKKDGGLVGNHTVTYYASFLKTTSTTSPSPVYVSSTTESGSTTSRTPSPYRKVFSAFQAGSFQPQMNRPRVFHRHISTNESSSVVKSS